MKLYRSSGKADQYCLDAKEIVQSQIHSDCLMQSLSLLAKLSQKGTELKH